MGNWEELKRLAEAATPGPWSRGGSLVCPIRVEGGTTYVESWRAIADARNLEDARYIADANPAAILALIAENDRLQSLASAMNSAMHSACMAEDDDPAELADVIHGLQVKAAEGHKLAAENARPQEKVENFKSQFSELHIARNLLSTLSRAGFPLGNEVAESILAVRHEHDQLRTEVKALRAVMKRVSRWINTLPAGTHAATTIGQAIDAAMGEGERADG